MSPYSRARCWNRKIGFAGRNLRHANQSRLRSKPGGKRYSPRPWAGSRKSFRAAVAMHPVYPKKLVAPASRVVPPASWVVAPASRRLSRGHLARAPRPKKELPRFPTTKIALPRRARLLQLVQLRQHFPAMLRRIHAGKNLRNFSRRINQERVPRRKLHHAQVCERSIGRADFVVRIGQQLEIEAFLGAERLMRLDAVEAHSHHHGVVLGVLGLVHLELVGFARSTRSLIFRIEIEDDPLAAVVFQAHASAVLRRQAEIG